MRQRQQSILKIMTWNWYFQTYQVNCFTRKEKIGRKESSAKKLVKYITNEHLLNDIQFSQKVHSTNKSASKQTNKQIYIRTNTRTLYHSIEEHSFLWHFNIQNWVKKKQITLTHTHIANTNSKWKTSFSSLAIIIVNTSYSISSALCEAHTMIKLPK